MRTINLTQVTDFTFEYYTISTKMVLCLIYTVYWLSVNQNKTENVAITKLDRQANFETITENAFLLFLYPSCKKNQQKTIFFPRTCLRRSVFGRSRSRHYMLLSFNLIWQINSYLYLVGVNYCELFYSVHASESWLNLLLFICRIMLNIRFAHWMIESWIRSIIVPLVLKLSNTVIVGINIWSNLNCH